jgi:hypothetical protein
MRDGVGMKQALQPTGLWTFYGREEMREEKGLWRGIKRALRYSNRIVTPASTPLQASVTQVLKSIDPLHIDFEHEVRIQPRPRGPYSRERRSR